MHDLAAGVTQFQRDVFPTKADLFAHLTTTHRPETLFISCSDARVVPELITNSEPGELFVIRTAGNLVPAYTPGADGVAASIEFAVAALGVSRIVVCGHSGCGAMTALAERHDLSGTPMLAEWLRHADASAARVAATGEDDAVPTLVRANVVAQLANLASHPSVARALAAGTATVEGWVFDIGTGAITSIDASGSERVLAA
ncbi:carbonic anhydrase [Rhodococcus maanshanensis]|uniref:Carbonic anhydrase n=1 Tax=Rhodococcus maanshanensis TaxID=183556 RepID=A0A1H7UZJ4_9NOCA|nr:carbonic anhydrase [Rhodococcus maanshanensis]SEM02392.1 carbonic anhydrase [Rhodococcus maanshanensis]